jgi:Icc-related predicted phosphoesterase
MRSSALLSRRDMMKLSAGALLAANLWPGRVRAAQPATTPLTFLVVNDLHYSDDACRPFFEGLVKRFQAVEGAAMVLIVGDLLDEGKAAQATALKEILATLKVPYYTVPGNHDWATQTDRTAYREVFADMGNQFFEIGGWQFVGLDTTEGTKYENTRIAQPTLDYAAEVVGKMDKAKPTFLFTHFPMGPAVKYRPLNTDAVLEPFKAVNLQAIFNGHYHAFTQKKVPAGTGEALVTTNRCCSRKRTNHDNTWEKGFFVVKAADGAYARTFVEYGTDFPGGAKPAGTRPAPRVTEVPASQPAY